MTHALSVQGLKKSFGGVPVLRDVSFDVDPGSITVLAGENGAGKSTLFKIISGQLSPDAGHVQLHGTALEAAHPRAARALGVGIVPQELAPYSDLSIAENLFVGRELRTAGFLLKRGAMRSRTASMLAEFGIDLDPSTPMKNLSVALTQIVEIIKATSSGASVLLLDEPTSSIAETEVERLYDIVRSLRARGVAMLYTTHRMAEIQAIADRVVTLRDGHLVLDEAVDDVTPSDIVTSMIGRELGQLFPDIAAPSQVTRLKVNGLRVRPSNNPIDLQVHAGEVLGIGGLVGAGRSSLLKALFGAQKTTAGQLVVDGQALPAKLTPSAAIAAGMAFVPEDRKGEGLALGLTLEENFSLPRPDLSSSGGVTRTRKRRAIARGLADKVRLRYRHMSQPAETLSGGNQQKIVIGRWLADEPKVLLLDEPTRGVDVGARGELYRIIASLAESGLAVVLVSSDMPELIGMSHRVCVMSGGNITGELSRAELDAPDAQAKIFAFASGDHTEEQATSPAPTAKDSSS
jgi:ribose transport system ATP-binding protein